MKVYLSDQSNSNAHISTCISAQMATIFYNFNSDRDWDQINRMKKSVGNNYNKQTFLSDPVLL